MSSTKTNTSSRPSGTKLRTPLRSSSASSKPASTPSSTIFSIAPTEQQHRHRQQQQICSIKGTNDLNKSYRLSAVLVPSPDFSIISSVTTPENEHRTNIATYSCMTSPLFDGYVTLSIPSVNNNMNETFDKVSTIPHSFSPPTTSSPFAKEPFMLRLSPQSLSSSHLTSNITSPIHDRILTEIADSYDSELKSTEADNEPHNHMDMSDLQYETYLQGEAKFAESTKNKPMLFMNNYAYLFMCIAQTLGTSGYRFARKDINCPTTIHIYTITNQFQRWNGKRHIHPPDSTEQR